MDSSVRPEFPGADTATKTGIIESINHRAHLHQLVASIDSVFPGVRASGKLNNLNDS
jgi:hypothetical protein